MNDPQKHRQAPLGGSVRSRGQAPAEGAVPAPGTASRADERSAEFARAFRGYLSGAGMKSTRQRELIATAFATVETHVTVDELLVIVRRLDPAVGYATVYRTLKLLVDAGLASLLNFGEGFARYEPFDEAHHEHLICEVCGRIEEFHDEFIEARQEVIARQLGYRLTRHRHDLFGVCASCFAERGQDVVRQVTRSPGLASGPERLPEAFRRYLVHEGLKSTRQRDLITELFANVEEHVSVEDLLEVVKQRDTSIGYATVYRTLKLLVDSGLAACRHFGDGFTRFEPRSTEHHDHLIDERTGEVIEFNDEQIEARQIEVAKERGFELTRHRHDLFGLPLDDPARV